MRRARVARAHDDEAAALDPSTAARADMTQAVHSREQTKITAFAHTHAYGDGSTHGYC